MSQTKWTIDAAHSEINFKVKHLMISTVTGRFNQFDLSVETDKNDFATAKNIRFTAEVNSIDTNNEQRNAHLKSADFFDVASNPTIIFSGTKYDTDGEDETLQGNLTIGKTTKPVTLQIEFGGVARDPWGGERAGFTVHGKISRREFGLTYNAVTEAGGVVIGDEIKINAEIELVRQADKKEAGENAVTNAQLN